MKYSTALALTFGIASTAACTTDSSGFEAAATSYEGIYRVTLHARNDAACTEGGAPISGEDGFAIARTDEVLGHPYLELTSCASVADCRDKLARLDAHDFVTFDFSFTVSTTGANGALRGEGASSGYAGGGDGVCDGGLVTATTFTLSAGTLHIAQRVTPADAYPEIDNTCSTDKAVEAAQGNACAAFESVTAELVEAL